MIRTPRRTTIEKNKERLQQQIMKENLIKQRKAREALLQLKRGQKIIDKENTTQKDITFIKKKRIKKKMNLIIINNV